MDIKMIWQYILANKEIIIGIVLIGSLTTIFTDGLKKILSLVGSILVLVAVLVYFGVPMEDIEKGADFTISTTQSVIASAKDKLPEYFDIIGKLFDKTVDAVDETINGNSESEPESTNSASRNSAVSATVHFVDVGQADCIFVQDGDDTLLIDVGNRDDDELVVDYLQGLGIDQIDYFVATHPHEDHIGCAATVLRTFDVDMVIKSAAENTTACYTSMMDTIEQKNIPVDIATPGKEYDLGDGAFQVLGPINDNSDDLNNCSVVIRYCIGDITYLFTGDAEREEEQDILDAGYDVQADVLKVGHHGSSTSTSYPWLRAVMPTYAVIMCGENNEYGHPHEETISKLNDADVSYYITSQTGTVVMETDGETIQISTEK